MHLAELMLRLYDTNISVELRESLYLYPIIETVHVIAITLFVGMISMLDLRLVGLAFQNTPVSRMTHAILPWALSGFAVLFSTGVLLFVASPIRMYQSVWFRVKLLLLIAGAVNAVHYHLRAKHAAKPLYGARVTGAISLAVWLVVITVGRMIAYHWFDCDRAQPEWVNVLAQCQALAEN